MHPAYPEIPFHFLSRKWVKILMIAFKAMEDHGKNPEKFYVYPLYRFDPDDEYPTYSILFYPHEIDWMNEGGFDVEDYSVVIKADTLQFIKIYQGRN